MKRLCNYLTYILSRDGHNVSECDRHRKQKKIKIKEHKRKESEEITLKKESKLLLRESEQKDQT